MSRPLSPPRGRLPRAALAFLVLGAIAPHALAREIDPELGEALPVIRQVARDAPYQAEQMLEILTRSHAHDPRPWLLLARLRVKLDARRFAALPLRRVAEIGPASYWDAVRRLQRRAGLDPLPDREEMAEVEAFRARAAEDACHRRRRDRHAPPVCPVTGAPFQDGPAGPPRCAHHPADTLGTDPFVISGEVYRRASRAAEPWLRAEAVRRVDSRTLNRIETRRFLRERAPTVRRALLERLLGLAPVLDYHPVVRALAREFAGDAHPEVRVAAWKLLHTLGEVPRLARDDLARLARLVDRGHISRYLLRAVCRRHPSRTIGAMVELLGEAGREGKGAAIRVLALDGGTEGLRHLARFLVEPSPDHEPHAPLTVAALRHATGEDHGRDGRAWLESLRAREQER